MRRTLASLMPALLLLSVMAYAAQAIQPSARNQTKSLIETELGRLSPALAEPV